MEPRSAILSPGSGLIVGSPICALRLGIPICGKAGTDAGGAGGSLPTSEKLPVRLGTNLEKLFLCISIKF